MDRDMTAATPGIAPEELLQHQEWLRALARHLVRDPHLAEDLVQDQA